MDNEYRILEDFPDYRVNRYGVVQSFKSGLWTELKQTKRNGYLKVNLCKNGKIRSINVNNIVGDAFIGRKPGQIYNHKNGVKTDNRVDNLEPCSYGENQIHAYVAGLKSPNYNHPNRRKVMIVETGEIFDSERACARNFEHGSQGNIHKCLMQPNKTYKGYHYTFVD